MTPMVAQSVPFLLACVVVACGLAAWALWDRERALRACDAAYEASTQAIAAAERAGAAASHWRDHALRDNPRRPALTLCAPVYHAPVERALFEAEDTPFAPPSYPAPALTGLPRFKLSALDGRVDPDGVHRPPPLPDPNDSPQARRPRAVQ